MNTIFDKTRHHIHIEFFVTDAKGEKWSFDGILDTGAPRTEFNDAFLAHAGFISSSQDKVSLKEGLQTQKYGKIILPSIEICGHTIEKFEVMVSHFEKSWGVAALIGLDFFRQFRVTIDYKAGQVIAEPFI
jgi:hypothetical protein